MSTPNEIAAAMAKKLRTEFPGMPIHVIPMDRPTITAREALRHLVRDSYRNMQDLKRMTRATTNRFVREHFHSRHRQSQLDRATIQAAARLVFGVSRGTSTAEKEGKSNE